MGCRRAGVSRLVRVAMPGYAAIGMEQIQF